MTTILQTRHARAALAALLVVGAMGIGLAEARGPWTATQSNTYGWQLMTSQERVEHQNQMRSLKTYEECKAFQAQHHETMMERAREKGVALPMGKGGAYGCDNLEARGLLQ